MRKHINKIKKKPQNQFKINKLHNKIANEINLGEEAFLILIPGYKFYIKALQTKMINEVHREQNKTTRISTMTIMKIGLSNILSKNGNVKSGDGCMKCTDHFFRTMRRYLKEWSCSCQT